MQQSLDKGRQHIARKVRTLRQARRWTQAELARRLSLSQSRLSEVENGSGSFTAEQFLLLLRLFNVGVSEFSPERRDVDAELQNALARFGADHLQEVPDVLPTEQLERVSDAVREAIVVGSSRQLTALGPVLVRTIDRLDLSRLRAELSRLGFDRRLNWILENVAEALRAELAASSPPPRALAQRYRRALLVIENAFGLGVQDLDLRDAPVDILDAQIRSKESLKETLSTSSALSRKWGVASGLTPKDFAKALRAARGG